NPLTMTEDIVIPTPVKTGYNFVGWKVNDAEDTVDSYTIASGSTGDVSLVAVWTAATYTITYDPNGGTVSSATQSVVYGEPYSLLIPTHSDPTKEFWRWEIEGTGVATSGVWKIDGDVTLVAEYKNVQLAVGTDGRTQAIWEGVYGNAGYVIYAGNSTTDRYVYTKNIFDGDSEGASFKLDAWPVSTNDPSKESNYHPFKVNGADPNGTIVSQFNDQTYFVRNDTTSSAGLYLPGDYQINKYIAKSSSNAAPSAVAFYVPETALTNSTTGTIYVSMYVPGESATHSAGATTTVKMVYSPSEDIVDLAPKALNGGSDTNNPGGLLFNNSDKTTPSSPSATLVDSQIKTFAEGEANGVYYTFAINKAGYYAIQNIDTVERGTWSGIFFDYEKPVIRENNSQYVSHKVGDPNAYAYYGADAWFYLATTATAGNVGSGHYMVSSNIIKNKTTGEMVNGESKGISAVIATRSGKDIDRTILLDVANKEDYALDGMITSLGAVSDTYRNNYTADWYPIRPDGYQRQPQIAGAAATQNGGWAFTLDADAFAEHEAVYVTFEDTLRTDNPTEPFTYYARLYAGWYLNLQGTDYTATEIKLIDSVDIKDVENNQAVYVTFKITAPGTYTYNARTGVDRPNMTAIYFDYDEPNLEATRNVVVTADEGASVKPPEVITVGEAAETFTVAANPGYKLSTITVAGVEVEITDPAEMTVTLPVVTASLKGDLEIKVTTEEVTVAEIESYLLVDETLYVTASTLAEADEFGIEWNGTKYPADDETKDGFFYTAIPGVVAGENTFRPYMTVDGDTLYGAYVTDTLKESNGKTHTPDVFGNVYFGDYKDADGVPHESTLFIIGMINGVVFGSAEIVEVGVTFTLWNGTNGTNKVITQELDVDKVKLANYTISDKNFGFAILNMDTAYSISSFKVFIKYADGDVVKSAAYDIEFVDGTYAIRQQTND
ncbi:MAG: InlB B-repeat-containing protein, partial [Clostridia bacterium]|nr:InlB B-repeat-containing protein [Clostridia bacterium]